MSQPTERSVLKRMLDHYDQLGSLRDRLKSETLAVAESQKLRVQSRRKIDAIGKELKSFPGESALGGMLSRYRLNKYQMVVLLALLRRRLGSENPYMKGRDLLNLLFDSSYDVLRGSSFLEPTATLLSAGLIVPDVREDVDDDDDVLESAFKISDRVFRVVRNAFLGHRNLPFPGARGKAGPYRSNFAYILDVRRLSLLYRKRASKIFQFDYWDDVGLGTAESVTALSHQIERFRERVEQSLKMSRHGPAFPLRTMTLEYSLTEPELIVLVTMLFQELTEGSALLDAVDLLKLISASEEDLLKNRRFLGKRSTLVKGGLVVLDEMVNDKELTAEVYLPNWVVDRMLGQDDRRSIDADARLDFHDYLSKLGSSEEFFEDLGAPE